MRFLHESNSVVAERLSGKTLLVVGESFYPDNTPRANRWYYFCSELDRNGWDIRVISRHFDGDLLNTILNCTKPVQRVPSLSRRICRRIFSMIVFEHHILWAMRRLSSFRRKIHSYKEIDIVIAYGLPFSGIVLGALIARLLGKPLVVEYGDPIDKNPALRPTLLERITNKSIMTQADQLIVTNENYAAYAAKVYGRQVECLTPVASLPTPSESEHKIRKNLNSFGTNVKAFYAGMFYQGIRSGVPFIEALERTKADILFLHAGKFYSEAGDCQRYRSVGYIDQGSVLHYLYWADIVLYFSNDASFQTPSKIIEIAHIAEVVLAIGDSFSAFEREMLSRTKVVYASNKTLEIEIALDNITSIPDNKHKTSTNFQKKIVQLVKYNTSVYAGLENIINKCNL